jgi:hypothetical protein
VTRHVAGLVPDGPEWSPGAVLAAVAAGRVLGHLPPRVLVSVLTHAGRGGRPATVSEVRSARDAVCAASVRAAGNGCVQRSIATFLLCRLHAATGTWKSGFRIEPFAAHAWVEAEGVPVGEADGVDGYHVTLATPDPKRLARA